MNTVIYYIGLLVSEIWTLSSEMAPYLLLGMLFSGLISIFIDNNLVLNQIGSKNISSILKSTVFGIPLPLCSCGVIPVAATLRDAGASKGATTSFLVSTPQTGIDSIFLTYGMLGPVYALFRPLAALISGIFSGIVINKLDDEKHHHSSKTKNISSEQKSLIKRIKLGLKYGFLTLPSDIVVPLFQGLIVAAVISLFIPPNLIADYFNLNSFLIYIVMLLVSLPLYVCATASIPIAVALMAKGISAGAVFVFLMAGPATNASSIAVIKNILGQKILYLYLLLISSTAIVFGVVLDTFFMIDPSSIKNLLHEHHTDGFISLFLSILFFATLTNSYIYKIQRGKIVTKDTATSASPSDENLSFKVKGMTCSHCKESVESAIYSFKTVINTSINLTTGDVLVIGNGLDENAIKEKIISRGFSID